MQVKEALQIVGEIDSQRQALNKIGEVLGVAEGIERNIKDLERQRERLKIEIADKARREHKAAAALLEAQHANETQRMKTELDRIAQSLGNARVEHESKLAAFEREEQEARRKHKAAALLEAQHANETRRMKTELDRLAQSLRNTRVEHESKLAAFEREEQEAKKKLDTVRIAIKSLTELFHPSASNLTHALSAPAGQRRPARAVGGADDQDGPPERQDRHPEEGDPAQVPMQRNSKMMTEEELKSLAVQHGYSYP